MAGYITDDKRKVTTQRFKEMKKNGEKISMLTSYDYTIASIVDGAGIDGILIGDSAANVMAGHSTTLPITIDQMIYHADFIGNDKSSLHIAEHRISTKYITSQTLFLGCRD